MGNFCGEIFTIYNESHGLALDNVQHILYIKVIC